MLSTIIEKGDKTSRAHYITDLLNPIVAHLIPEPTSIGIKAVQELVMSLSISTSTPRVIWIEEAQALTTEANNALLKVLEEPPSNTYIYLTCPIAGSLLPTIRSRCQIISLSTINYEPSTKYLSSLKPLFALSPGDRLQHLSDFPSDKVELLVYLSDLAKEISETIKKTKSPAGLRLLSSLGKLTLKTHQALKSNTNQTMTLTHYLLHLPKSR